MLISRSDRSKKAIWFWTIDRWIFTSFLVLCSFGAFFIMASGTKIAAKLNFNTHFFTLRHFLFLLSGFLIALFLSNLNHKKIKILSIFGLIISFIFMLFTFTDGISAKGAQRWVIFFGQSIQPSEFIKPFFIIVNAWLLHLWKNNENFKGWLWSMLVIIPIIFLLLVQPDIGMTLLITLTWGFQLFLTGIPLIILLIVIFLIPMILLFSYLNYEHVFHRINRFLEGNTFQTEQATKAFENGSLIGKGIGEGFFKNILPDAHTDFIFAVIAEEFGIILCCGILLLYGIIIFRSLLIVFSENNLFIILSVCGLSFVFGIQSIIHISSNLALIPTKGMTLPFLSYGGSSTLSSAIIIGMILSLTRKQIDLEPYQQKFN